MSQRETLIDGRARPRVTDLTPAQIAGQSCLWCGAELANKAVKLPVQKLLFGLAPACWYPRRCPDC